MWARAHGMQEVRHVDPAVDDALRVMGGGLRGAKSSSRGLGELAERYGIDLKLLEVREMLASADRCNTGGTGHRAPATVTARDCRIPTSRLFHPCPTDGSALYLNRC